MRVWADAQGALGQDLMVIQVTARKTWRDHLQNLLSSVAIQSISAACLLIALFGSDVAQLAGSQEDMGDKIKDSLLTACLIYFFLELCMQSVADPAYRFGFFFFMDIIGTLSLILDISWILDSFGVNLSDGKADGSVLRAARTARVGARAGRLTRAVRIIKLLRMRSLLKYIPGMRRFAARLEYDDEKLEDVKPSLIGKKIAEAISKKVRTAPNGCAQRHC